MHGDHDDDHNHDHDHHGHGHDYDKNDHVIDCGRARPDGRKNSAGPPLGASRVNTDDLLVSELSGWPSRRGRRPG